jgi:hypothetical protein
VNAAGANAKNEKSRYLPDDDKGAFYLLLIVALPGCAGVDMLKTYNSLTPSSLNNSYILT